MAAYIIALEDQIGQYKGGVVGHDHIMAAKGHEDKNTDHIDKKRGGRRYHIGQSGAGHENGKNAGDTQ